MLPMGNLVEDRNTNGAATTAALIAREDFKANAVFKLDALGSLFPNEWRKHRKPEELAHISLDTATIYGEMISCLAHSSEAARTPLAARPR